MITEAPMFPVDTKTGTLTIQASGGVAGYLEVIGKRRGEDVLNPDSLTMLLHNTENAIKSNHFYHVLELTEEQISTMKHKISLTRSKKMQETQKRALRYWTLDLSIGSNTVSDTRLREMFALEGENLGLPLSEQNENTEDLFYVMQAQRQLSQVQ